MSEKQPETLVQDNECGCLTCKLWRTLDMHYAEGDEAILDAHEASDILTDVLADIIQSHPDEEMQKGMAMHFAKLLCYKVRLRADGKIPNRIREDGGTSFEKSALH